MNKEKRNFLLHVRYILQMTDGFDRSEAVVTAWHIPVIL